MSPSRFVTIKLSPSRLKKYPLKPIGKKKTSITIKLEPESKKLLAPKPNNTNNANNRKAASPTPETPSNGTPQPSAAQASKSGFGRNAVLEDRKLDKSGKGVRKWTKKPLKIQSFTGYSITFQSWTGEGNKSSVTKLKKEAANVSQPPLKIQFKMNNKSLIKGSESGLADSREASPAIDDASSIVSTPEPSTTVNSMS